LILQGINFDSEELFIPLLDFTEVFSDGMMKEVAECDYGHIIANTQKKRADF
jgi:hypothetical protein